ncbi:alternative oxidase, mitochondrial-like [Hylaeus volcanicus]|uniref:alternative oxidase, mitochondrial-like n=1 Tax=Hylaeus volcanicus TaxID=313075 RepID=UPI0023B796E6|nr:alternative oxidase, mitochondrial-like [Hylaeus volcanicus]
MTNRKLVGILTRVCYPKILNQRTISSLHQRHFGLISQNFVTFNSKHSFVGCTQISNYFSTLTDTERAEIPDHTSTESLHFIVHRHKQPSSECSVSEEALHTLPHPVWDTEAVENVRISHKQPEKIVDKLAYGSVKMMRFGFDVVSGYALGRIDERGWLNRIVFLETVAGVPGMVGAMVRHLKSLRHMDRDNGWIHTLLEEAENERMHLMTILVLRRPSYLFRMGVLLTQGIFLSLFSTCYLLCHRFCHRFVAYLEEEAVVTYTKLLSEIDNGHLPLFEKLPAPILAKNYWKLPDNAMFRDVILAIRADEDHHRLVNHTFAQLDATGLNPFLPGQ